ncbi:MAG: SUMF1/EgtB/PvdO family nonheme iron enzyme, partial [Pseudomonadota bacterium]
MTGHRSIPMTIAEFARIDACEFLMGSDSAPHPEDGEGPRRPVHLDSYQIARSAVCNEEFAGFVRATGYLTTAERQGVSHVFYWHLSDPDTHAAPLAEAPWWREVRGAHWRRPDGANTAIPDHPVVHVSFEDAQAYCAWRGARLPTEAEWECAAAQADRHAPNIWQGEFPNAPSGVPGTRAVQAAQPNMHGLFHACGNVWEWTADGFGRLHSPRAARNPSGNLKANERVVKGGSYLCASSYCARFRPSSRRAEHPQATTGHLGFRIVAV